jgi:subtilase family serine protease
LKIREAFWGLLAGALGVTVGHAHTLSMAAVAPGHARAFYRVTVPNKIAPGMAAAPVYLGTPVGLTPDNAHTLYGYPLAMANGGKGETIAVVDAYDDPNIETDLGIFDAQYGLPACTAANGCFTKVYAGGSAPPVNSGWAIEMSLDVEWAHAMAPQAKILLVEAASNNLGDLFQGVSVAASNANVVSMSWGSAEFMQEGEPDVIFEAFPSVTFVAASGDGGFGASYPAASPYVVAVGGTTIEVAFSSRGVADRVRETAWSSSGGGLSEFEPPSEAQSVFLPNLASRAIPDVSYIADPVTGFSIYDSVPYQGYYGWFQVGGTSAGAPQWSALVALAESASGQAVGTSQIAYALYSSFNSAAHPLNDITIGTNGLCGTACLASPGFDLVTGLGTPRAANVIKLLAPNP